MDREYKLGLIFKHLASELNISDTLYEKAVTAYTALAEYIKTKNQDWDVEVFPQGSFELGTVIRPVNDEDQYDVDLVILINKPSFDDPKKLRDTIQNFLESHGRYDGKIEEKKQCLRVIYSDSAQFHMDVVCAVPTEYDNEKIIDIAKKDEVGNGYNYSESNPKGYIEWFKRAMKYESVLQEARLHDSRFSASTQIQELSLAKMKTPLQQAIRILKRHRDIYFQNNLDDKPSSIIITTLCALCYEDAKLYNPERANVYSTVKLMLERFPMYISPNTNWEYNLSNPSYAPENFLFKWNTNERLKNNFSEWIKKAQIDIVENPESFLEGAPLKMRESMHKSFGVRVSDGAFKRYGEEMENLNKNGAIRIDTSTLSTTLGQSEKTIIPKPNTFYGDMNAEDKKI